MASKVVLVQLDQFCRKITLDLASEQKATERELLLSNIRATFSDRINHEDSITLQRKDEEFGMFIDFFDDEVLDKSIFKTIVEKPEVCTATSYIFIQI